MAAMKSLLIDGPSLIYRAFYAVPPTLKNSEGTTVNAVRGFTDMVATLYTDRRPDEIVAVIDADWRPAFRVEAYAGFKSQRAAEPPELTPQWALVDEVMDAAGIRRAEAAALEADDVIATLAARVQGDDRAEIITGDRDLLCLVRDPHVRMFFTVKGVREMKDFDEAAVEAAYGIPPRLYCEFAILRGDPSDGLPGVIGVGPKRATALIQQHGSIEEIYRHLDEMSPKQAQAFENARDYIEAMRVVVPPVVDADVVMTPGGEPDEALLRELAERHNLGGSVDRLLSALRS
jgi:5'-3' exonuclease